MTITLVVAVLLFSFSLHFVWALQVPHFAKDGHSVLSRPTATSHNLLEVYAGTFASIRGACKANIKWPPKDPKSTKTDQVPMSAMCGTFILSFKLSVFSSDHTPHDTVFSLFFPFFLRLLSECCLFRGKQW